MKTCTVIHVYCTYDPASSGIVVVKMERTDKLIDRVELIKLFICRVSLERTGRIHISFGIGQILVLLLNS